MRPDKTLLGPWIRRFLLEYLKGERNFTLNTLHSYRDTLKLLLPFLSKDIHKPIDRLKIEHVSADHVRLFLKHLEESRHCGIATRNQRLSAIRSLAHFIGMNNPEHIAWCGEIRGIPFKKSIATVVPYLEKEEMDALLAAPDQTTAQGRRDYGLLLFLYNSGARADETAQLVIRDIDLLSPAFVKILGKGNKVRHCPLWPVTTKVLKTVIANRDSKERLFLNRCGQPITRFGIYAMVERHVSKVVKSIPSLATKQVSPHTIRHTTAVHLLRAGVDINTIRAWLGHISLNTTNIYAEVDLEMKAKALATCDVGEKTQKTKRWREDTKLMSFLCSL
jgi:site-specific recombinase XerD